MSMARDDYRGWSIDWDYGRFTATGPNYDASWEGEEDGWVDNGECAEARTREDLIAEIDAYIEEHDNLNAASASPEAGQRANATEAGALKEKSQ